VGYKLLGMIAEKVTGKRIDAVIDEKVFKPYNMASSCFPGPISTRENSALGHDGESRNRVIPFHDIKDKAATGMFTSLRDLTMFLKFLNKGIEPPEGALKSDELVKIIKLANNNSVDTFYDNRNVYSSGWYLDFYQFINVNTVISNSGNVNGFSSELAFIPEKQLGIIILTNSSTGWKADVEIAAKGLRFFIDALYAPPRLREKRVDSDFEPMTHDELCGRYGNFGVVMDIYKKRGKLHASFRGPPARMIPIGPDRYKAVVNMLFAKVDVSRFTDYDKIRFQFYKNSGGKKLLFMEATYGESTFSIPLHHAEKTPIPDCFRKRLGTWVLSENSIYPDILKLYIPSKKLTLFEKNGWLMIKTRTFMGMGKLILHPLSDTQARIIGSGETITIKDDALYFIGIRFKRK
jgi:hypothetical protein